MTAFAPHKLAAAALLSLPFLAHAAAAGTFSGSAEASITDLRYHLVDLAPDDGQAPELAVYNLRQLGLGAVIDGVTDSVRTPVNPLPVNHVSAEAGPGTRAEAGPTALITHALADGVAARLPQGTTLTEYITSLSSRGAGMTLWDSPDQDPPEPQGLVLAPHTALVLEGTALLSTAADAGSLLTYEGQAVPGNYQHVAVSTANISIRLTRAPLDYSSLAEWVHKSTSVDKFFGSLPGAPDTSSSDRQELPFLLTLTNDSDDALQAYFDWTVSSGVNNWASVVPEPGTWALVAAGLLVLPLARRARAKPY